jgi:hypothetical protein
MPAPGLAIVGAGPQSLALVLTLLDRDPTWRDRLTVIDPSGCWLASWRDRFRRHRIDRLRSAAVHHPHPDPTLLRAHARRCDRLGELHDPYDLPGTALFDHFCDRLLHDEALDALVVPGVVAEVQAELRGATLVRTDGSELHAPRVVLATNPVRRRLPPEVGTATLPWRHSDDIDLGAEAGLPLCRIDVVGGGLTAVQLAVGAAEARSARRSGRRGRRGGGRRGGSRRGRRARPASWPQSGPCAWSAVVLGHAHGARRRTRPSGPRARGGRGRRGGSRRGRRARTAAWPQSGPWACVWIVVSMDLVISDGHGDLLRQRG